MQNNTHTHILLHRCIADLSRHVHTWMRPTPTHICKHISIRVHTRTRTHTHTSFFSGLSPIYHAMCTPGCAPHLHLLSDNIREERTFGGHTLLYTAAYWGLTDHVSALIHAKCNVSEYSGDIRTTPLMAACARGHVHVVELLLDAGVDVASVDANGMNVWHHCLLAGNDASSNCLKAVLRKSKNGLLVRACVSVMHTCIDTYTCMNIYIYIYVYIYIYIYGCMSVCMCVCMYDGMRYYAYIHEYVYIQAKCTPTHTHTHILTYANICVHTHIHAHLGRLFAMPALALCILACALCVYTQIRTHTHLYMCLYTYIRTRANIYIYTYIHTHTRSRWQAVCDAGFSPLHIAIMAGNVDTVKQFVKAGIGKCMCVYIHKYTHTHTHACM
jgi:hypothetical protein